MIDVLDCKNKRMQGYVIRLEAAPLELYSIAGQLSSLYCIVYCILLYLRHHQNILLNECRKR
jgi:hypothetical protein